jgi:hypothetical protein
LGKRNICEEVKGLLTEPIIIVIALVVITVLLWIFAEKIYQSHYSTKKNHPFLFKITGFNEKYLDDPEQWIKHFRIQLVLIAVLFLCALWIVIHGL